MKSCGPICKIWQYHPLPRLWVMPTYSNSPRETQCHMGCRSIIWGQDLDLERAHHSEGLRRFGNTEMFGLHFLFSSSGKSESSEDRLPRGKPRQTAALSHDSCAWMVGGRGSFVISSWNAPESGGKEGSMVTHCFSVSMPSGPMACLPKEQDRGHSWSVLSLVGRRPQHLIRHRWCGKGLFARKTGAVLSIKP